MVKLSECVTEAAAESLIQAALTLDENPRFQAIIGANVDNTKSGMKSLISTIISKELCYHPSCYSEIIRPVKDYAKTPPISDGVKEAFLRELEQRIFENFEVLNSTELTEIFNRIFQDNTTNQPTPIRIALVNLVCKHFGDRIASWTPRSGPVFIFNNEVEKGHIVESLVRQINALKKEFSKSHNINEKIREAALRLRSDIKEVQKPAWPLSENELFSLDTQLPETLSSFLGTLLSYNGKPGKKTQRCIKSFGQDLIYTISNGRTRTKKHVLLSFAIKRKTGSKDVLRWINRYGHGISYDEVNVLETFLAEEATYNQTNRRFCPSSVQPSRFLTFVWDNNDINPESLNL